MTKGTQQENQPIYAYKDTVFRMIYRKKEELLSLYNAVNGTHYTDVADLEITTLENAVYMNMKNDVSCIIDMRMNLYEHQSTVNPNMPLRNLFYIARLYEKLLVKRDLYSKTKVVIPAPKFFVFYNGKEPQPDKRILKLSDSYGTKAGSDLELIVTQYNINIGYNNELMKKCKTLAEYAIFVEMIRNNCVSYTLEEAVTKAVNECIAEGVLEDFLRKNKAEVIQMSIFEYDEELHKRTIITETKVDSILELLEDLGEIPESLEKELYGQTDFDVLKRWLKIASKAESIEQFAKEIKKE